MNEMLFNVLTSTGCSGIVGLLIAWLVQRQLSADSAARKQLEAKVENLETEKLKELKNKIDAHLADDNPQAQRVEIRNLTGAINKLSDKLDLQSEQRQQMELRIEKRMSTLESAVSESRNFTQNLYLSMQKLRDREYGN